MRILFIIGWGMVLIGAERMILSPTITGNNGIEAALTCVINMGLLVIPGLMLIWHAEDLRHG